MDCQKEFEELSGFTLNFDNVLDQYLQCPNMEFDQYFKQILCKTIEFQWKVAEHLKKWKREQQASIISGIIDYSILSSIQKCNTVIMKIYLGFINVSLNKSCSIFKEFIPQIENQFALLLQNAFLVVEQPCSSILKPDPLTIISNAKFEVKLAILLDHQMLDNNWKQCLESINLRLLAEEEIRMVSSQGMEAIINRKPSFNIINKGDPIFKVENEMLTISIVCNLKVDINRRGHNPKAIPVAEKKFKFIFWLRNTILNKPFVFYTFSLPVNVLSRKDYRNSYATIIWDNAFPLENREMFETRDFVTWPELAQILNLKFHKDVGANLCSENLNFIYTMIPNRNETNVVTWEQFAKILLPMRQFTFFEWFYKTLILVREQLSKMYCDGLIHGFMSSVTSEQILKDCIDGTFLIRFSETFCGAITISYVKNRKFDKLLPWDLDRLKKMDLCNTIKCIDFLLYLYPNVPKDEVFGKYYVHKEFAKSITGKDYSGDANTF